MTLDWKLLRRLMLMYLAVWIPLLGIGTVLTMSSNMKAVEQARTDIAAQVERAAADYQAQMSMYSVNSASFSSVPDLRKTSITSSLTGAYDGIYFLKYATLFDGYSSSAFLDYGTGIVYSAQGYTRTTVYLSRTLQLGKYGELEDIQAVLNENVIRVVSCWTGTNNGFLLLHYPENHEMSVNYVLPFSSVRKLLYQLSTDEIEMIEIELSKGGRVCFGRDGEVSDSAQIDGLESFSKLLGPDGMTLRAYYHPDRLTARVRNNWQFNILLMAVGVVVSLIATLYLSCSQMRRIQQLEMAVSRIVGGGTAQQAPSEHYDEYSGVRRIVSSVQKQYSGLRSAQQQYQAALRHQVLRMLIHHLYMDEREMQSMLEMSGVALCEEYFVIGAVDLSSADLSYSELAGLFSGGLYCEENFEDKRLFCFLMEMPNPDIDEHFRGQTAERIRSLRDEDGPETVYSQVLDDLNMVSYAWQKLADQFLKPAEPQNAGEMAEFEQSGQTGGDGALLREKLLSALYRGRFGEAEKLVKPVLESMTAVGDSSDEQSAQRYELVNRMLAVIHEKMPEEEEMLLNALEGIRYDDQDSVQRQVCGFLQRIGGGETQDTFERAIEFLAVNYADCNLTSDQVAEHIGINKTYMSRLFKSHTGMSYIQYLTMLRMEQAKMLLRTSDMQIHDIVLTVGYLDDSSFRKKFKEHFGFSVSECRKQNRNEENE